MKRARRMSSMLAALLLAFVCTSVHGDRVVNAPCNSGFRGFESGHVVRAARSVVWSPRTTLMKHHLGGGVCRWPRCPQTHHQRERMQSVCCGDATARRARRCCDDLRVVCLCSLLCAPARAAVPRSLWSSETPR